MTAQRYDIIIRIPLSGDSVPQPPRAIVKYRTATGHIRRAYNGKPCPSFEAALVQAVTAYKEHIGQGKNK